MHKLLISLTLPLAIALAIPACKPKEATKEIETVAVDLNDIAVDRFADIQVLRYEIPGFESLELNQKILAYYLYEAALSGRDIIYDQHNKHNLMVRKTIETIWETYSGDKTTENWKNFEVYSKRVWFSNGIHHHYASDKMIPAFDKAYFAELINQSKGSFPKNQSQSLSDFISQITPIVFDPNMEAKTVNLDADIDNVQASANNFYEGVTQKEVEEFYAKMKSPKNKQPLEYGLNSKLVKENGKLVEKTWKVGGMYGAAIEKIVYWLEKAVTVAETPEQKKALELLVAYYKTGDLKTWDDYNIAWVADVNSVVDVVNGFIEVYGDAVGKRGTYESVVSIKDFEATKKIEKIAANAQWFEVNAPLQENHKKKTVKGIIGKAITVIVEGGDAPPSTPIGINLPNSNWVRQEHGSKSVSLTNIVNAYNLASAKSPSTGEFSLNEETKNRAKQHGNLASELHTDMHEVIGHASGQLEPGVATPDVTLKNYQNTLEEARADLVALYYIYDQKLVDLGVMPSLEVGKAEYDSYLLNGLMLQLNRIEPGKNIEESHMRNRQLVSKWVFEKGAKDNVAEFIKRDGKTFVQINDYQKLKMLFGDLLREIQRIKSQGDFKAGQALVENYGVKVDADIHKEVKARFSKLNIAPYKGFIQPRLVPVEKDGKIVDVKVEYPRSFSEQMLEFGKKYSFLPINN